MAPPLTVDGRGSRNVWSNGRFVSFAEYQNSNIHLYKYAGSAAAPRGSTAAQVGGLGSQAETVYSVIVPDATLALIPGTGADCGLEDRFSKRVVRCSCDRDHECFECGGTSCGHSDCPRHWQTWAHRAADRIGRVVMGWKETSKGRHDPRHTILSIDDTDEIVARRVAFSDRANLRYFRKYFIADAKSLGGTGGSICTHLWRTNDEVPVWIQDDRRWDWVRKQYNWRKYVKFSPHAHIIGYGFYAQPEKGDFAYKNMPALKDRDAVESVAFYQVSHAPVGVGNAYTFWGCCQPGYLRPVVQGVEHVPVFCSKCGAPMIYEDNGDEYLRRRSWAIYEVSDGPVPKKRKRAPGDPAVVSAKERSIWGKNGTPVRHAALLSDSG